ncbi:MAG: energy transducer TonB, partial [Bacteroidales bacterium]|nr:energy transducer TonB [Bacteroidales bacterium]
MVPLKVKSGFSYKMKILFISTLFLNIAFNSRAQDNSGCLNEAQLLRMQKTSLSDIRTFLDMEGWTLEKTQSLPSFQSTVVEWQKSIYENGGTLKLYMQSGKPNIVSYKSHGNCFLNLLNSQDPKSSKVRVINDILLTSIVKNGITIEFRQYTSGYSGSLNSILIYNYTTSNKEMLNAILQAENSGSAVKSGKEPVTEVSYAAKVPERNEEFKETHIQEEAEVREENKPVYTIVEEMPYYPGGESERNKFLATNIVYPRQASENGIQGTVYVSFVVDSKGNLTDVKVLRGIGGGCDEEALRVVKM